MTAPVEEQEYVATDPVLDGREPGDHDKFSHYVTKRDLEQALFNGKPATALCGKKWLPNRDPDAYPVCPERKEIWENLPDE